MNFFYYSVFICFVERVRLFAVQSRIWWFKKPIKRCWYIIPINKNKPCQISQPPQNLPPRQPIQRVIQESRLMFSNHRSFREQKGFNLIWIFKLQKYNLEKHIILVTRLNLSSRITYVSEFINLDSIKHYKYQYFIYRMQLFL